MMEKKVIYFEKPGRSNTEACLNAAKAAVDEYGYRHVVVATTTGETGVLLSEAFRGSDVNLVVVTHSHGFKEPNETEMPGEARERIIANGAKICTATMPTHSLDTAFSKKFSGSYLTQIVAGSLRRFGEGAKVCCECVMMAADGGLLPEGEEVVAVAGTARGADTVAVLKSAASKRFFDLRVLEFVAKPRNL
jgi:hypothetical protein